MVGIAEHRAAVSIRIVALAFVLVLSACDAKEGATCSSAGEARCQGNARMLVCSEGRWSAVTCGGPSGCSANDRFVDCDERRATPGDPCGKDGEGAASCNHDGKSSLECRGGAWQTFEQCPAGCTVSADRRFVDCDGAPEETLLLEDE
jgi:hypothetical protein